jgi:putative transposase
VQERLFGTVNTEFIKHLLGNTQALHQPRVMTRATDPRRQAVWTLPAVAERVRQWADEEYDTIRHPALGMTPREAYALSIERDGARAHKLIPYDDTFLMATLPTTRKGSALVQPGVGVRMNHLDYWCDAMRDPTVERTAVKVRYDPFDVSIGYVYLGGRWRRCITPYNELAGCSERELQQLTEELRRRNQLHAGRASIEVTQKQLATFRRENAGIETILRQQRHDRESRAALSVLEGGNAGKAVAPVAQKPTESDRLRQSGAATPPARPCRPMTSCLSCNGFTYELRKRPDGSTRAFSTCVT